MWSILHSEYICSLGYFPFLLAVHNWSITSCRMCCPVCGKIQIKDLLLLIGNSSLCGDSRFPLKKYVPMTICLTSNSWWYKNECVLEVSLNQTNFPFFFTPCCTYLVTVCWFKFADKCGKDFHELLFLLWCAYIYWIYDSWRYHLFWCKLFGFILVMICYMLYVISYPQQGNGLQRS